MRRLKLNQILFWRKKTPPRLKQIRAAKKVAAETPEPYVKPAAKPFFTGFVRNINQNDFKRNISSFLKMQGLPLDRASRLATEITKFCGENYCFFDPNETFLQSSRIGFWKDDPTHAFGRLQDFLLRRRRLEILANCEKMFPASKIKRYALPETMNAFVSLPPKVFNSRLDALVDQLRQMGFNHRTNTVFYEDREWDVFPLLNLPSEKIRVKMQSSRFRVENG